MQLKHCRGASLADRLASAVLPVAVLASLGAVSGCSAEQEDPSVEAPDPAAERALEDSALAVAMAFADRDRGQEKRTEAWLPQLRGEFEAADGVEVGHGQAADDGLVLLAHAATGTYKCIAVTGAADVASESANIARISTGEPRC